MKVFLGWLAGVLLLGAAAGALLLGGRGDTYDPVKAAAEARAIERAEQLAGLDLALAAGWRLLPFVAAIGAVALAGRWLWLRSRIVKIDGQPIDLAQLDRVTPAVLATYGAARMSEAQRQPVPHSFTYAPHFSHRNDMAQLDAPISQLDQAGQLGAVPTFAELLASGQIGRGQPLLLGIDQAGAPIEGSWTDLFSCGIGGLSGSGKSWTAVVLLSQAMLHGARVCILDPHGDDPESLTARLTPLAGAGRYMVEPAHDPRSMLATVELIAAELAARKAGRGGRWPLVVVADEFSALQRGDLAEPLARLFESLAQEGRKMHIYGMALGQSWTATRSGGSELRDSLASCYLHRLRPAQARMLSGLTADDLPDDILELPPGGAYLLSTRGELQRLTIPRMDPADVVTVARMLTDNAPTMAALRPVARPENGPAVELDDGAELGEIRPDSGQNQAGAAAAYTAPQSGKAPSAEAAQVAALFLSGVEPAQIVKQLYGLGSKAGAPYQKALREVHDKLRSGLAGQ